MPRRRRSIEIGSFCLPTEGELSRQRDVQPEIEPGEVFRGPGVETPVEGVGRYDHLVEPRLLEVQSPGNAEPERPYIAAVVRFQIADLLLAVVVLGQPSLAIQCHGPDEDPGDMPAFPPIPLAGVLIGQGQRHGRRFVGDPSRSRLFFRLGFGGGDTRELVPDDFPVANCEDHVCLGVEEDLDVLAWVLVEDQEVGRLSHVQDPHHDTVLGVVADHAGLRLDFVRGDDAELRFFDEDVYEPILRLSGPVDQAHVADQDILGVLRLDDPDPRNQHQPEQHDPCDLPKQAAVHRLTFRSRNLLSV